MTATRTDTRSAVSSSQSNTGAAARGTGGRSSSGTRQIVGGVEGFEQQSALLRPPESTQHPPTSPKDPAAPVEPTRVDLEAARMYVSVDPRLMAAIGEVLDVQAEPPGPELITAVRGFQTSRGLEATGLLDETTLTHLEAVADPQSTRLVIAGVRTPTQAHPLSDRVGGTPGDTGAGSKSTMQRPKFLGTSIIGGVHHDMVSRLAAAESSLQGALANALADPAMSDSLGAAGVTDTGGASLGKWLGIKEPHTGWREGAGQGYHRYGLAIDINRNRNAWHPVRTDASVGGEGTGSGVKLPQFDVMGLEVIDRACLFLTGQRARLHAVDKGLRNRPGETKMEAERFASVSRNVADYFGLVFVPNSELLTWGPSPSKQDVALPTNLCLLPDDVALANIKRIVAQVHGGSWPLDAGTMLMQIRKDLFPLARASAKGTMSEDPKTTKNPTQGIIDIDSRLAEALTEKGRLFWGACEFGDGSSGDSMHFDTGIVP